MEPITDLMEEELTYAELLSTVVLNGEIVVTVFSHEVDKIKIGLKNLKAKQNLKLKEEGLLPSSEILEFIAAKAKEGVDYTDLRIILRQRAAVKIKKLHIPDNTF